MKLFISDKLKISSDEAFKIQNYTIVNMEQLFLDL